MHSTAVNSRFSDRPLRAIPAIIISTALLLLTSSTLAMQNPPAPRNNQSMSEVLTIFGPPLKKISAVGQPPISRWRYRGYTVYFENQRVITSVLDSDLFPNSN